MANLIEQMNVLKGLDDASLQGEIQSPSGSAPPFLVLTEINRRKDMRQRYDSDKARQKPSTTVVEDVAFGLPAMPASTQGMPGGIGDAMGAPMPPVQGFNDGGLVEAMKRYNTRLSGLGDDRDRARAMALLAASGAILGGGSSNTLKNVGAGIGAFAGSYGDQLKNIDSQEIELLRGISTVGQEQRLTDMAEMDRDFRERQLASQQRQMEQNQPENVISRKRAEWVAAGRDPSEPAFQNWALGLTTAESAPTPEQEVELKRQAWTAAGGDPNDVAGFQQYALGIKPYSPSASTEKRINDLNDKIITGEGANKLLDEALDLNTKSFDNLWAEPAANVMGVFGDETAKNTLQLKNATIGLALEQLRSIFGAMPTEGERKVLIEFQGSVSQPRDVRETIYKRAKETVARRLEMNRLEAEALASGKNFSAYDALREYEKTQDGSDAPPPTPAAGTTTTDIPWSR
jgi:hypothetical protein